MYKLTTPTFTLTFPEGTDLGLASNHIQNIHLSNVTIAANADVSVRVRSRGNSYYGYVGTLTIIEA